MMGPGKRHRISTVIFVFCILLLVYTCKDDNNDPCKDTTAPDKSITMLVTVEVVDESGNPLPNQAVEIEFERHPCGKSDILIELFEGTTDSNGEVNPSPVTITLNNTADDAFVTATAINLVSSKKWSNRTYHYADFSNGHTANLLMTIKIE